MKIKTMAILAVASTALALCAQTAGAQAPPTLYSWGVFGNDSQVDKPVPVPTVISGVPGTIVAMTTSNAATYVLNSAGQVWAFGFGGTGALGRGNTRSHFTTPARVKFPEGVVIASLPNQDPFGTAMAIDTSGNVWGWGSNNGDELCLSGEQLLPVELPLSHVTLATGGGWHSLYDAGGVLYQCGGNEGTVDPTPTVVTGLPSGTIRTLVSSYEDSGALMSNGAYWDWGLNDNGQIGDGTTVTTETPFHVLSGVAQVAQGGSAGGNGQTIAILTSGTVKEWGANGDGQLCNGTVGGPVLTPQTLVPPAGVTLESVASGGATTYLLDSAGRLWACGRDSSGQIGDGSLTKEVDVPQQVLSNVAAVSSTGSGNVAAIL